MRDNCPECGCELGVELSFDSREDEPSRPLQGHALVCENDHVTPVAILYFPDERYQAITPAYHSECHVCSNSAEFVVDGSMVPRREVCLGCVGWLYTATFFDVCDELAV